METSSNNYLISELLTSAQTYKVQYLSMLEQLVSSLTTNQDKINILTEVGTISTPSNQYLIKKITNLENLLNQILSGQNIVGTDGISRIFKPVSNINSDITISNQLEYSSSRLFLELFTSLKCPIGVGKANNVKCKIYKILNTNIPDFINENYKVNEGQFLIDASSNDLNLSLVNTYYNSIGKKAQISGKFAVIKIDSNKFMLNTLKCDEPIRNLLESRELRIGDILMNKAQNSVFSVSNLEVSTNSVFLTLISGIGRVSVGDYLYIKQDNDNEIFINVLPNEKIILFLTLDGSVEQPKSLFVDTSSFTIIDAVGNVVDPTSLSQLESMANYFKGVFLERRLPLSVGVIPQTPILNNVNFKVVNTNSHNTTEAKKYKVIGFWDVPNSTNNQEIVSFKVQFRSASLTNTVNPVEGFVQQIRINNNLTSASYSAWSETQTSIRKKALVNGVWTWLPANESDVNVISFNSISLPIANHEKIQVRVKSLSEAGIDTNNSTESEWSNIIDVTLDEVDTIMNRAELSDNVTILLSEINVLKSNVTLNSTDNLQLTLTGINNSTQSLSWGVENLVELTKYQDFLNTNSLSAGSIHNISFDLKIKNLNSNQIQLRNREFTYDGVVKTSRIWLDGFDSVDREYNELLRHDLFGFGVPQSKSQIFRLRSSTLSGNLLMPIQDNNTHKYLIQNNQVDSTNLLKEVDYSKVSSLLKSVNNNIYTPSGFVDFDDVLNLNLTKWFYVHKDANYKLVKANPLFNSNFNIPLDLKTAKNSFTSDDKYLVGDLSVGLNLATSTDLNKIQTDNFGNYYLNPGDELTIKIEISSRYLDYMGRFYYAELSKILGFDIFLKDQSRKSFDVKFKQS